ncbi:MAG TPA: HAMP domain-containing histidine kinase [Helicobacteraceae bacterium]|nr:HAMP domain-containing histidine kinase [Helicobacteraceae bacterium]
MSLHSLRAKISLIFFFALVLLVTAFTLYYTYQETQLQKKQHAQYLEVLQNLHDEKIYNLSRQDITSFFSQYGLEPVSEYAFLNRATLLERSEDYSALTLDKKYYFHLHLPFMNMLFVNTRIEGTLDKSIIALVVFILMLLFIVYFWILKSLAPLRHLQQKVQAFGAGNYEVDARSDGKDEIAMLSNEFHNAAEKIHTLITSRQLFLRTIMHELKTPIAKGRIVSGLLDDAKQKGRLDKIFMRLDGLIDEFANIEQVVSKNYELIKKPYKMSELLAASIDMLMLEESQVDECIAIDIIDDFRAFVDFDLYTLALKNLLDNALKYASDKKVRVEIADMSITLSNQAKALNMKMDEYFKPFHNDVDHQGGLGLGIYIVKSIIDLHQEQLRYHYKEGRVVFSIKTR